MEMCTAAPEPLTSTAPPNNAPLPLRPGARTLFNA